MNWREHIVRKPDICHGAPTIRGTRVMLRPLLASLAKGMKPEELRVHFPSLSEEDVNAVIAYAAEAAEDITFDDQIPLTDADQD